jgi:predicted RNase H-like nuclease
VAGRVRSLPATCTAGSCPCRATIASHAVARAAAVARATASPGQPVAAESLGQLV